MNTYYRLASRKYKKFLPFAFTNTSMRSGSISLMTSLSMRKLPLSSSKNAICLEILALQAHPLLKL